MKNILLVLISLFCFQLAQCQCSPKKVSKTYFSICPESIKAAKKSVEITSKAIPKKVNGKNEIHLVHFYTIDKSRHATDEQFLDYANSLKNLETKTVSVNGREFTGIIRLATPFIGAGDNNDQSGYNILELEYADGKLTNSRRFEDVDLEKGTPIPR